MPCQAVIREKPWSFPWFLTYIILPTLLSIQHLDRNLSGATWRTIFNFACCRSFAEAVQELLEGLKDGKFMGGLFHCIPFWKYRRYIRTNHDIQPAVEMWRVNPWRARHRYGGMR